MKLLENMTLQELKKEVEKINTKLIELKKQMQKSEDYKNDQNQIAQYFKFSKVGFRKDSKKQDRDIEKSLKESICFSKLYEEIKQMEKSKINIENIIQFLVKNSNNEKDTKNTILQEKRERILNASKKLNWRKDGTEYIYEQYKIKKVDDIVFIYKNNTRFEKYFKTIKEAKSTLEILIEKEKITGK